MKVVCISDTHWRYKDIQVPDGDLLVHTGDFLGHGLLREIPAFNEWIGQWPHKYKVVIPGNHDQCFEDTPNEAKALLTNAICLIDEAVDIEGYKVYGTPWQPVFFNWAFNVGPKIREQKYGAIPNDTDILLTHNPPYGILDTTQENNKTGCEILLENVQRRISPMLHVFGHIHEGYGWVEIDGTYFVNAACLNAGYQPVNAPIVIELPPKD